MELDPAFLLATDRRLRRLARELVSDSGADDVVQETWLAALERPGEVLALPGWLGTVARRMAGRARRGGERRARREAAVARAEAIPSTGEILAREETRQRVVAAVLALAEPLRTTLVLRYLEDLPPRTVAARMQTPVETVRARTRRGLELLRAELDRDFGGRERWLSALAPLSIPRASRLGLLPLAAAGAAGLGVLALGWLLWPGAAEPSARPEPLLAAGVVRAPALAPSVELERGGGLEPERRSPSARSEPPAGFTAAGSIRVQVSWMDRAMNRTPAADVPVRVTATEVENAAFHALVGMTDATGVVVFESVPCGKAWVDAVGRDIAIATVLAGETSAVELTAYGLDMTGIVVDAAGQAVAGAEIWGNTTEWLMNGMCLAQSGNDGRFAARGLGQVWIGARAAGHAPAEPRMLFAQPGATVDVRFVLGAGGSVVAGTVVALGTSTPLAGVLVRIGGSGSEDDSERPGGLVRSDEEGRFRIEGLASGNATVLARVDGMALFRGSVAVPEQGEAALTLALEPEAVLTGHVRDAAGAPLAGVRVNVGETGGPFEAATTSAADGSFRVGALEAGRTLPAWIDERRRGCARTEFASVAGASASWEAVLELGGELRGRVLDAAGEPLVGWSVWLSDEGYFPFESDRDNVTTAADGSFVFVNVHDRAHRVTAMQPSSALISSATRTGVRPGPDELLLRVEGAALPSARIAGTFLDEEGRPIPDAQLIAFVEGQDMFAMHSCDPTTGRFDLGPYPPRRASLNLAAPGRAPLNIGPHELVAGQTWDVGTVRLAPEGRLVVQLVPVELELADDIEVHVIGCMFGPEGDGSERTQSLPPGAHTLLLDGDACAELALDFEIQSGADTVLEVPLLRGWRTTLGVRTTAEEAELRVSLPTGGVLTWPARKRQGELLVRAFRLAPGSYSVEAVVGTQRATGTVVVEPEDGTEPALVLSLE
jgi:RNA polymerase sigma factor (sigma-70 family)